MYLYLVITNDDLKFLNSLNPEVSSKADLEKYNFQAFKSKEEAILVASQKMLSSRRIIKFDVKQVDENKTSPYALWDGKEVTAYNISLRDCVFTTSEGKSVTKVPKEAVFELLRKIENAHHNYDLKSSHVQLKDQFELDINRLKKEHETKISELNLAILQEKNSYNEYKTQVESLTEQLRKNKTASEKTNKDYKAEIENLTNRETTLRNKLSEKELAINDLEGKINQQKTLKEELEKWKNEYTLKVNQLETSEGRYKILSAENAVLKSSKEGVDGVKEKLEREINGLNNALFEKEQTISKLQTQLQSAQTQYIQQKSALDTLERDIKIIRNELEQKNLQYQNKQTELDLTKVALNEAIKQKDKALTDHQNELTKSRFIYQEAESLKKQVENLKSESGNLKGNAQELENLRKLLTDLKTKSTNLETRNLELTGHIKKIQEDNTAKDKEQAQKFQDLTGKHEDELHKLKGTIDDLKHTKKDLEDEQKKLKDENEELKNENQGLQNDKDELEKSYDERRQRVRGLKTEKKDLVAASTRKDKKIEQLEDQLKESGRCLYNETEKLKGQIADLERQRDVLKIEGAEKQQYATLIAQLSENLRTKEIELQDITKKLSELNNQKEKQKVDFDSEISRITELNKLKIDSLNKVFADEKAKYEAQYKTAEAHNKTAVELNQDLLDRLNAIHNISDLGFKTWKTIIYDPSKTTVQSFQSDSLFQLNFTPSNSTREESSDIKIDGTSGKKRKKDEIPPAINSTPNLVNLISSNESDDDQNNSETEEMLDVKMDGPKVVKKPKKDLPPAKGHPNQENVPNPNPITIENSVKVIENESTKEEKIEPTPPAVIKKPIPRSGLEKYGLYIKLGISVGAGGLLYYTGLGDVGNILLPHLDTAIPTNPVISSIFSLGSLAGITLTEKLVGLFTKGSSASKDIGIQPEESSIKQEELSKYFKETSDTKPSVTLSSTDPKVITPQLNTTSTKTRWTIVGKENVININTNTKGPSPSSSDEELEHEKRSSKRQKMNS